MTPLQESGFMLSELKFRDSSAIFIENPNGTTFGKKIRPIPRKNPGYGLSRSTREHFWIIDSLSSSITTRSTSSSLVTRI